MLVDMLVKLQVPLHGQLTLVHQAQIYHEEIGNFPFPNEKKEIFKINLTKQQNQELHLIVTICNIRPIRSLIILSVELP